MFSLAFFVAVATTTTLLACQTRAFGPKCPISKPTRSPKTNNDMPVNYKVAFVGDQALGVNPSTVLRQIRDWGAQAVYHQGDFDYEDDPQAWDDQINSILGESFPYFASLGNHDILRQTGYQQVLNARLARIPAAECVGDTGMSSFCFYNGILATLNGMGLAGEGHEEYVDEIFSENPEIVWKLCSWHNNHHDYQVGDKPTSVSLELYDTCLRHGAIVATGHEHSYGRTHLMSSFSNYEIVNESDNLEVTEGRSFVFCQGLGGRDIRDYSGNQREDWWAATAAGDDDVSYGPLYCTFNVNGQLGVAECFFQDIQGEMWDNFTITNTNGLNPATRGGVPKPACTPHNVQSIHTATDAANFVVDAKHSVTMTFPVDVRRGEVIDEAYVEVLGRVATMTNADSLITITVGNSASMQWNMSLTELDEPVWKTVNIADILTRVINADAAWVPGKSVVVTMHVPRILAGITGAKAITFDSGKDNICFAPTLSIFLKQRCN